MVMTVPATMAPEPRRVCAPLSGADLVCESLLAHGVDTLFGYPGGAALPLYHRLNRYPLRHVLVRHEQNAAHAADGYARATGRVGVCVATSGPGATNLVTGLATAAMDSVPLVALTGQVATGAIGTQAFQEVDIVSIVRPITKGAFQARSADELPALLAEAFSLAQRGRPGPVLVDLPKDVQLARSTFEGTLPVGSKPAPAAPDAPLLAAVDHVAELLTRAERPVLVAGHGVVIANAFAELWELAERAGLPVGTTLLGLSSFPEWHPLALGMVGMHGTVAANMALHHADLVLGVGMRFDDRVVGRAKDFAPGATVVHVDVDPAAFGRTARADVAVLADARLFLQLLADRVARRERPEWTARLRRWRDGHRACGVDPDSQVPTSPQVIGAIREATDGQAVLVADVGQHQMFAALHFGYARPKSFFTTGGLGTMGYAVPAAMGVKLARPDEPVWAVVGDGGFQMSAPELSTLVAEQVNLKIAVLNNGYLGMVRQWQELFYEGNYSHSRLPQPDFARLAEAHGCVGLRVTRAADVRPAVEAALAARGPVVLDFTVVEEETVYPMIPPGAALGELRCADPV
jgi:acetolactate synthase-1/2/3 large subunit